MADAKTDFNASEYLAGQQSDIQARHNRNKKRILREPGEIGTFETKPYTIVKTDAGFEMKGRGAIDATLTGPKPRRPDRIIQEEKKTF